jgi:broad specificity phosphatase PhoE
MSYFIFVRHAQSKGNAEGTVARADSPLSELGLTQAAQTGAALQGKGITRIACAPTSRAKQTAEIIAFELGIDAANIVVVDELRERDYGHLEGRPKEHPPEWYFSAEEKGVEPHHDLIDRMHAAFHKLHALSEGQGLLAIGSAVSGFVLRQVAQGKTELTAFDPFIQMENGSYAEVPID